MALIKNENNCVLSQPHFNNHFFRNNLIDKGIYAFDEINQGHPTVVVGPTVCRCL